MASYEVYSGVVSSGAIITSGGTMVVFNGGTANSTTVNSGGAIYVSSGGTATDICLESGALIDITVAQDTYIQGVASVTYWMGNHWSSFESSFEMKDAYITDYTINSNGQIHIEEGGIAERTTFIGCGLMSVSSGGIANITYLSGVSAQIHVLRGGVAGETTIDSFGCMYICGGEANSNTVGGVSASVFISNGGVANETTLYYDGCMYIGDKGTANGVLITSGASVHIYSGGIVNKIQVIGYDECLGEMYVSGGVASNTIIGSAGKVIIADAGTADYITVSSDGCIVVSSGGTVTNIIADAGGILELTIAKDTFIQGTSAGSAFEVKDASIADYIVNSNGGLSITSGGSATNIIAESGAKIGITVASDTYVQGVYADSAFEMTSAYLCYYTIHSGGTVNVEGGGTAENISVNSGGTMVISSGGTATNIEASSGAVLEITVAKDTYIQGGLNGAVFEMTDGYITNFVLQNGGYIDVESGGVAESIIISSGGTMQVFQDGTANSTSIIKGGEMYVFSGGSVHDTYIGTNADCVFVFGGTMSNTSGLGNVHVAANGTVDNVHDCTVYVSSGGVVNNVIGDGVGDYIHVSSGGVANNVIGGGTVQSGGTINNITLHSQCTLSIESGAIVNDLRVEAFGRVYGADGVYGANGASVTFASMTYDNVTSWNYRDYLFIHDNCVATNAIVDNYGEITVFSGGTMQKTTVNGDGQIYIEAGGYASDTVLNAGFMLIREKGGANDTMVNSGCSMLIYSGGMIAGQLNIHTGAKVTVRTGAIIDFTVAEQKDSNTALITNWDCISGAAGANYTLTVSDSQETGTYKLATGAGAFDSTITINGTTDTVSLNNDCTVGDTTYSLAINDSDELILSISAEAVEIQKPQKLTVSGNNIQWEHAADAVTEKVVAEYSTDGFNTVIRIETDGTGLSTPNLPVGEWEWRVQYEGSGEWAVCPDKITVAESGDPVPTQYTAIQDNIDDIFFVRTFGKWTSTHLARHTGIKDEWTGTQEAVVLNGQNRFGDIFEGCPEDTAILYLTDDANGDALFVDDIFTAFPEEITEQQSRLANIDFIFAGSGNDIVDMTSQRFDYIGDGLSIHGGSGNDTIWSNKGNNFLFGDAGNDKITGASGDDVFAGGSGNDTMQGGGGNDVFCFGGDWGDDVIRQLTGGNITLWFGEGITESMLDILETGGKIEITSGDNSVTVWNTALSDVTFKFGDDSTVLYDTLYDLGAFSGSTTEKIFESGSNGILAG